MPESASSIRSRSVATPRSDRGAPGRPVPTQLAELVSVRCYQVNPPESVRQRQRIRSRLRLMPEDRSLPVTGMERLVQCRRLPAAAGGYAGEHFGPYEDYVTNVLLTVLDLQMHNVAVDNAIGTTGTTDGTRSVTSPNFEPCSIAFQILRTATGKPPGTSGETTIGRGSNGLEGSFLFLTSWPLTSQERLKKWAATCDYQRDLSIFALCSSATCRSLQSAPGPRTAPTRSSQSNLNDGSGPTRRYRTRAQ